MQIREGSIVRIDVVAGAKAGRVGVVFRLVKVHGQEAAFVTWPTPTLRPELVRLSVAPDEPAGVALGLTLPSYFYAKNSMIVAVDMLEARSAVPPYLLAALRVLFALR